MTSWAGLPTAGELWIFGYGSLMWRPGFAFERAARARLTGWRRCFCIYSTHHRGNSGRPGLVLGLDRGGVCDGVAYRVPRAAAAETLAYLRAREQLNGVYSERLLPVTLDEPGRPEVLARAYVVERCHPSYAGRLPISEQARLIRAAEGRSGPNLDYLINTLDHIDGLGIREPALARVLQAIGPHFARIGVSGLETAGAKALLAACARLPIGAPRMRPGERRRFTHRKQLAVMAERAAHGLGVTAG
ncbi:MAG: gamma-glutamylcyclotransferase [Hyphomicrobiaceae bacterium]